MLVLPPAVNAGSAAVTERPVAAEVCQLDQKFDAQAPVRVELKQRHFACGDYFLALDRNPHLLVDLGTHSFELVGWNIRLPTYRAGEISREIIRKFLVLLGKAERRELNEREDAEWSEIVKQVDYRKFSIETAPPIYVEGQLLAKTPAGYEVEWHDGEKEIVPLATGDSSLGLLNAGEWFKAFGKFGEQNRLVALSQLVPVPPPAATSGEALWQSWPSNRS